MSLSLFQLDTAVGGLGGDEESFGELSIDKVPNDPASLADGVGSTFTSFAGCDLMLGGVGFGLKTKLGSSGAVIGPAGMVTGLSANIAAGEGVWRRFSGSRIDEADVLDRESVRFGVATSDCFFGDGIVFHLATARAGSASLSTAVDKADSESTKGIRVRFCFSHGGMLALGKVESFITTAESSKKDSVERSIGEKS